MTRGHLILEHSIDQLKRGSQYRRDLDDDLDELCASIQRTGVLNPPAVTEEYVIITGNRRGDGETRDACHPVWVVPGVSDKPPTFSRSVTSRRFRRHLGRLSRRSLRRTQSALCRRRRTTRGRHPVRGGKPRAATHREPGLQRGVLRGCRVGTPVRLHRAEGKARAGCASGDRQGLTDNAGTSTSSNRSLPTTPKTPMCANTRPKHCWRSTRTGRSMADTRQ